MLLTLNGHAPLSTQSAVEEDETSSLRQILEDLNLLILRKADPVVVAAGWKSQGAEPLLKRLGFVFEDLVRDRFEAESVVQGEAMKRLLQESRKRLDLKQLYGLFDKLHEFRRISNSGISVNLETLLEDLLIDWLKQTRVKL